MSAAPCSLLLLATSTFCRFEEARVNRTLPSCGSGSTGTVPTAFVCDVSFAADAFLFDFAIGLSDAFAFTAAAPAGVIGMGLHFAWPRSQICEGTHSEWSAYGPMPTQRQASLIPESPGSHSVAVLSHAGCTSTIQEHISQNVTARSPCSSQPIVSFTLVLSRLFLIHIWAGSP